MPIPAATYDPLKTIVARQSIFSVTSAGTTTHLLGRFVDYKGEQDLGRLMGPGAGNAPAFTSRIWAKSQTEMLMFKTTEVKKVITLFGGKLTGLKHGTNTSYMRDPDDAANTVVLKTDDFPCSVYRDPSTVAFSGDNPAEVTLVFESRKDGLIDFTPDASTA